MEFEVGVVLGSQKMIFLDVFVEDKKKKIVLVGRRTFYHLI